MLQRLSPEFPDLSPSKLRFLEDRHLVKPGRTPAGYRTYSHSDVERLRFILGVQRDHYLPLKVIKSYLDELDAGGSPELPGVSRVVQPVAVGRPNTLERKELIARSGASKELVDEAISQGLISPGPLFDPHHLRVVESLVQAETFGLTPRHLRGLSQAVAREVDLVCHAVDAKSEKSAESKRSQKELQRELADIVQQLRVALVRQALEGLES
ncbi:MerR family transcriptional regulator [Pontimonas sp.]|uniref:transcriptional regulator FtsR n=1 Tax=Pontimonas sp. TaxID=2304492 RepID=UPI00286FF3AB|nr:MerR family transcriptional regulator [Pontimonas sp.]MDR9433866.1 MerR family transcriptional regulator [Pontimonas sp.]